MFFRRKHYTLYQSSDGNTCLDQDRSNLNSTQQIQIQDEKSIISCTNYFPNVIELTFKEGFSTSRTSLPTILHDIIPLKQLTQLIIQCHHFSFKKIIDLLRFTPNIHTLTFESMPFYKDDYASIEQSESFQLISNINTITHVTFKDKCTLAKLQLLVGLCPRVQHLSINTLILIVEPITRFLLDKTNPNTQHLYSLHFSRACRSWSERLDLLIKSETLLNDYKLKSTGSNLHLWW